MQFFSDEETLTEETNAARPEEDHAVEQLHSGYRRCCVGLCGSAGIPQVGQKHWEKEGVHKEVDRIDTEWVWFSGESGGNTEVEETHGENNEVFQGRHKQKTTHRKPWRSGTGRASRA